MTTKYYVNKNGKYLGGFGDGAVPPVGSVEVPKPDHGAMTWNGDAWVVDLTQARANASMPRAAFILAALDAGVLTETDAEQAVNGWPAGWDSFFDGQPVRDRIAAKAEWASTTVVRRNAPLIAQLAAFKGLTDAQVDALFDITP